MMNEESGAGVPSPVRAVSKRGSTCLAALGCLMLCAGCGSSAEPTQPPPTATSPTPEPAEVPEPAAAAVPLAEHEAPASEPPPSEPIDLLRAAPASVAVSSAYRDDPEQVSRLVDGDLETAWNSRTGDLAGAWIAFRIPEDASVTSIGLTAGFTRVTDRADLFTGNHRVARVRVTRAGETLVEHALDVGSREVQSIPVEGGGGDYRIELVELTTGSRADWRETCVSELRVMGRVPAARPGELRPRTAVGELPVLVAAEETPEELAADDLEGQPDALYLRLADRNVLVVESEDVGPERPGTFARGPDGRIWMCVEDGSRAEIVTPSEALTLPAGMRCGPMAITDGHPWVFTQSSLAYWDGVRWAITPGGSVGPDLRAIAAERDGTLWVVATAHVYRRRNGAFEELPTPIASPRMFEIHAAGSHVLIRHEAGLLRWDGQALTPVALSGGPLRLSAAALAADGTVVAAESGSLFVAAPGAAARRVPLDSIEGRPMHVHALAYDASARLWMWADSGLYILAASSANVVRRYPPGSIEELATEALGGELSAPVQEMIVRGEGPALRANGTTYHVRGRLVRGGQPLADTTFYFCTNPERQMRGTSYGNPCEETSNSAGGYSRYLRTRADGTFDVWDAIEGVPVNVVRLRSEGGGWYFSPDRACCERLRPGRTLDLGDLEVP